MLSRTSASAGLRITSVAKNSPTIGSRFLSPRRRSLKCQVGPVIAFIPFRSCATRRPSLYPGDLNLLLHLRELTVTGHEVGLLLLGERGGKAVGIRHPMLRLEPGGLARQRPVGVNNLDAELSEFDDAPLRFGL